MAFDVVIAGGGFGGLYAARRLERRLQRYSARIRIVSDVNFLRVTGWNNAWAQPREAPGGAAGDP